MIWYQACVFYYAFGNAIGLHQCNELACFCLCLVGAQEDQRGLRHGTGFPSVPGPAGLHARPHLPR